MKSLYWDAFEERSKETILCLRSGCDIPVRRVSVFITEKCNFRCNYCNQKFSKIEMSEENFDNIVRLYGDNAIIHITGGEPSVVKWLYPYLENHGLKYRFHLNTNAFILPPSQFVKRLKVSLDSHDPNFWNATVGRNAFDRVVNNIKLCIPNTVVSITFTMTRQNYRSIPDFIKFSQKEFPGIYAVFFSVYKGNKSEFLFTTEDAECFFKHIKPQMDDLLDNESKSLLNETIEEKCRIIQGERFPENKHGRCYLSMSERVFLPDGSMYGCSHLVRDGIRIPPGTKHDKCLYGCNRRLVSFNEMVEKALKNRENL